jgi:hypothetical protein|nr:MAG TPA: hypothetical protein [Herelleviridae sp.]
MDIVKDIKGNVVNVGDTIKFLYCDFDNLYKKEYIISKIKEIDYENKEVIMESGHSCKYSIFSKWEEKRLDEELKKKYSTNKIGGEKIDGGK